MFADLPSWLEILGLLSIPALILLNGLFVAAEFSLVSLRLTRVEEMVNHKVRGARAVEAAVRGIDRTIAATQLGITLSSILLGWVGEPVLANMVRPLFEALPWAVGAVAAHSIATGLALLLITYLHVVFGEFIPKTLAIRAPDRTALWMAQPLVVFEKIARPLIAIIHGTGQALMRRAGFVPVQGKEMVHSVEELLLLIEDTEEAGILPHQQAEFAQNIFRLSGKRVVDCMVPRDKMATLEINSPSDKILEAVRQGSHTRMPVYDGTLDNIVGIVNTKDLFYLFSLKGIVVLEDAIYPPLFLKPEESIATALTLFRTSHRPMALVRDSKGAILGVITLEDILEEIVGEIEDEHDRPTPKLSCRSAGWGRQLRSSR